MRNRTAAGCGNYGKYASGPGAHQPGNILVLYFSQKGPRVCSVSTTDGTLTDMGAWPVDGGYAVTDNGQSVCLNDYCGAAMGHAYALYGDLGVGPDLGPVTTNSKGQAAITYPNAKTAAGCGDKYLPKMSPQMFEALTAGSSGASRVDGPFVTPFSSVSQRPGASPADTDLAGQMMGSSFYDSYDLFNQFETLRHEGTAYLSPQVLQEVSSEPDVAKYASGTGFPVGETLPPRRTRVARRAAGDGDQASTVTTGIWPAFQAGNVDTIGWTQIPVNEYEIMVSNEPLSVGGLRLPTNMNEEILIANALQALPITPAVSNARWANATNRQTFGGLGDPRGAVWNDPGQVIAWNAKYPQTGVFSDGYWKEGVIVPGLTPTSFAQFGGRTTMAANSPTVQQGFPGPHDWNYKDYSNTPTYMGRTALKNGVQVDLLDELEAGCSLGGPLPAWLVAKFRGGNS
jgi:hypothetical protein